MARILYLDDEAAQVLLFTRMLEFLGHSAAGFTVPADVLQIIRKERFDLVVTDLSMPTMNGFELAQELLAIEPGMAIAIVSGCLQARDVEMGRAAGALEVTVKPHTIEDMSRTIERLLQRADAIKTADV